MDISRFVDLVRGECDGSTAPPEAGPTCSVAYRYHS